VFCRFDLFCYPICISFIHRFKVMIKAEHAGDTCSAFSDVVNFVVGRTQDFAGSAVVVDVPGVRKNDSEHLSWTMLKFAALRPSQSPLFVLKFDLLLATCTSPTTLNGQASSLIYGIATLTTMSGRYSLVVQAAHFYCCVAL
jgi:hypothetical protein